MRTPFPLFDSHLDLAHSYWRKIVTPGSAVIDATCGNGNDTLVLAKLCLTADQGTLFAMDIQPQAIQKTRAALERSLDPLVFQRIQFLTGCHSHFPSDLRNQSISLIVYNLGYLPGSDKSIKTSESTTLVSLKTALRLMKPGGMISVTCYPGHPEGLTEQKKILIWSESLSPKEWSVCHHQWVNRSQSPSLLVIQKSIN
jgi:ubiquinone/menaquinone biosynthesis C-methylase UbiE